MKKVLLVGSSFKSMREYLKSHGIEYLILRDLARTKHPNKKFKHIVVTDFSSDATMLKTVENVSKKHRFNAVIANYENYILPAAKIASYLGLPGLPIKAAEACTDKELMREAFSKSPIGISPAFAAVESEADLKSFAARHGFPLILKPANLAKSLLVTKNHNLKELLENYRQALSNIRKIYAKYAPNRTPKLIVEEFMQGSIHSVDAFVDSLGVPYVLEQVVDYETGYDVGYEDNFHYSRLLPSRLSRKQQTALREVAALGCQALGMKNSPAHIEIILTKNGPKIVEIGARNGGYRERMHALSNGINILGAALGIAMGEAPQIDSDKSEPVAVIELFPKKPGKFKGIKNEKTLKQLPSLVYLKEKAEHGAYAGKSSDGYKMSAIIILHSGDNKQFEKDLSFVREQVEVQTD